MSKTQEMITGRKSFHRSVWLFIVLLAGISIVIGFSYFHKKQEIVAEILQSQQTRLKITTRILDASLGGVNTDVRFFQSLIAGMDTDSVEVIRNLQNIMLTFMQQNSTEYSQLRFIDDTGQERIRIDNRDGQSILSAEDTLQNKAGRYYVKETFALQPGQIYHSPMDLNKEHGRVELPLNPTIRIAMPVYKMPDGMLKGMVIINYKAADLLEQLETGQNSSRLWMLNQQGYWLIGDHQHLPWGFMLDQHRDSQLQLRYPDLWTAVQALEANVVQSMTTIADGIFSMLRYQSSHNELAAQDAYWLLITRFEPAQIDSQMLPMQQLHLLFVFLGLIISLLLTYGINRFLQHRHWQNLQQANRLLEEQVEQRTHALNVINKELEAFAYSVSHDLRTPLRTVDGFSKMLLRKYADKLDDKGVDLLDRMQAAAQNMGSLIEDLLHLSRISRQQVSVQDNDLSQMASGILQELQAQQPERQVSLNITPGIHISADRALLKTLLNNLLGNAWKYTAKKPDASIKVSAETVAGRRWIVIQDNGDGFDMKYADKLFTPFQRLHSTADFQGSGVGLSTVQRIVNKHNGRIEFDASPGEGAMFKFYLG